jgi:LAS superfamily LD-carboxypeptidase LdcB
MFVSEKKYRIAASLLVLLLLLTGCGAKGEEAEEVSAAQQERLAQLGEDAENGLFIVINKENSVTEDYKPDDLESIKYYAEDRDPQWRYLRAEAADKFHEMVEAARDDGIDFVMTTAYRSYAFQTILWNNAVTRYGSEEAANNMVARPGESEHQSGLDVDISSSENNYQLNENFGDTEAGKWVSANAADYGFVLRYPSDKTDITGYGFEPWHLRYVGETAAKEITEQGLALEEYVEQLQDEGIL